MPLMILVRNKDNIWTNIESICKRLKVEQINIKYSSIDVTVFQWQQLHKTLEKNTDMNQSE